METVFVIFRTVCNARAAISVLYVLLHLFLKLFKEELVSPDPTNLLNVLSKIVPSVMELTNVPTAIQVTL